MLHSHEAILGVVRHSVLTTPAIDLHTHLFPPAHGSLMLWGIDSILTYHYLVAELFTTLPPAQLTPRTFYSLQVSEQVRPGLDGDGRECVKRCY